MTGPSDDAVEIQPETLTAETVVAWLRRHPEFLEENPEVLTFLTPPEFKRGERVLDMQHFMLERMRDDLTSLRRNEKALLRLGRLDFKVHDDWPSIEALLEPFFEMHAPRRPVDYRCVRSCGLLGATGRTQAQLPLLHGPESGAHQ